MHMGIISQPKRTIDSKGKPYNECSTSESLTMSISPCCIYKGCTPPYPFTNDVVIDLFKRWLLDQLDL
ncbi:hypothetical protein RclHR1_00860011 [Rhizophagus clarus]|uniref:Uncharacterized protein n=1 Tax=Rhizophagus clarus TaxID=94130 RepID=A0A2Z6S7S0_9GLOM|nr:hypothetical protein RclHR1_00860011 [Rhizophagus clarus]